MNIPVSIQTDRRVLLDLAETPGVGGWIVLMLALGPPTAVGLCVAVADLIHYLLSGATWGFVNFDWPFVGDHYIYLVLALAVPFNLLMSYRFRVKIRILYMPAWVFGGLGLALMIGWG